MNRKLERKLVVIGASWQILSGLLTIFAYGSYIKSKGSSIHDTSFAQMKAIQSLFGSLYSFTVTFGMLFVILGIVNLYLVRSLKDDKVEVKRSVWFLVLGVSSYFLMDFIGAVLFLSAGILALAKNKTISRLNLSSKPY
ncbi:hypothetical protein SAMN04488137_0539 [Fictibacillus solisalsi]|uniref:DUF4064 domain-containing protein n=1 Tax=Fictibacillus solisalsi TaxID=459525 RepID=A0A1G9TVY5_9BACL|nr:DUF4064 domain-containing protein [Fictibacillus solisalsi]SDM51847.1 hypothetical protein SAMN04488137_0539 [Fictibacillus solisalsi]